MSIFDFIADILFKKQKNTLTNIDTESIFSPYMINRWVSMYSNSLAIKCNLLNKYLILDKKSLFSLFINIFDKVSQKKITYFKKTKEKEKTEEAPAFHKALELSRREIYIYEDVLNYTKVKIK